MRPAAYLKDSYKWLLRAVFVANVTAFWVVIVWQKGLADIGAALKSISLQDGLLGMMVSVGAFLVDGLLSADTKARIVYWRWRHPLPGSRAFSRHLLVEPRADPDRLLALWGPFPGEPARQNRLWYRIYQSTEKEIRVQEAHRAWLFSRDLAAHTFLFVGLLGSAALIFEVSPSIRGLYLLALGLQYIVAALAARTYGVRFVRTVLAIASSFRPETGRTTNPT